MLQIIELHTYLSSPLINPIYKDEINYRIISKCIHLPCVEMKIQGGKKNQISVNIFHLWTDLNQIKKYLISQKTS